MKKDKKINNIINLNKNILERLGTENNLIVPSLSDIVDLYFSSIVLVYKNDNNIDTEVIYKQRIIDKDTIEVSVFEKYIVVSNEKKDIDKNIEIKIKDASKFDSTLKVNDLYLKPVDIFSTFSRSSVNKVKSIFTQKCNIINNERIYETMSPLKGKIVIGIIDLVQNNFAKIRYNDIFGFFPKTHQVKNETLVPGKSIELIVENVVKSTTKTFPLIFSRNSNDFLIEVFKDEVPEISDGIISIKKVARMPGVRSKVVLYSKEALVDPVGSCLGKKGDRINSISRRCSNERIDLIKWSDDEYELLSSVLGNFNIYKIINMKDKNGYEIIIDDKDLSMAIGKMGSNIKLARIIMDKEIEMLTLEDAKKSGYEIREEFYEDSDNNNSEKSKTENKNHYEKNIDDDKNNEKDFYDKKENQNNYDKVKPESIKDKNNLKHKINISKKNIIDSILTDKTDNNSEQKYESKLEKKLELEASLKKDLSNKNSKQKYKTSIKKKDNTTKRKKEDILTKIQVDESYDLNELDGDSEDDYNDFSEYDEK